jgi:hypothetical protein
MKGFIEIEFLDNEYDENNVSKVVTRKAILSKGMAISIVEVRTGDYNSSALNAKYDLMVNGVMQVLPITEKTLNKVMSEMLNAEDEESTYETFKKDVTRFKELKDILNDTITEKK